MDEDAKELEGAPLTFTVGDDTRVSKALEVLKGLRLTVLMGERAAEALAQLESKGFHDAPVKYVHWDGGYHHVRTESLPALLPASEDELPNYGECQPVVLGVDSDTFCGHRVTLVRFGVSCDVVIQMKDGKAVYARESSTTETVCSVRLGKKAVSMEIEADSRALRPPKPGLSDADWSWLRQELSKKIVNETIFRRTIKKTNREVDYHAKTKALKALAKKVLFEKHADRLLRRAFELAPVAVVMKS